LNILRERNDKCLIFEFIYAKKKKKKEKKRI
jgi:hypothetical protein